MEVRVVVIYRVFEGVLKIRNYLNKSLKEIRHMEI